MQDHADPLGNGSRSGNVTEEYHRQRTNLQAKD